MFVARLSLCSDPMTVAEMRQMLYLCNIDSMTGEEVLPLSLSSFGHSVIAVHKTLQRDTHTHILSHVIKET